MGEMKTLEASNIVESYFVRAASNLALVTEQPQADKNEYERSAKLHQRTWYEMARYADEQYRYCVSHDNLETFRAMHSIKESELSEATRELKLSRDVRQRSVLENFKRKVKLQFDQDLHDLNRAIQTRDFFLNKAVEGYLTTLEISDDYHVYIPTVFVVVLDAQLCGRQHHYAPERQKDTLAQIRYTRVPAAWSTGSGPREFHRLSCRLYCAWRTNIHTTAYSRYLHCATPIRLCLTPPRESRSQNLAFTI